MTFLCTAATIVHFLGYMPEKGVTITIQRSTLAPYSERQIERAKRCATKHNIKWRIEG